MCTLLQAAGGDIVYTADHFLAFRCYLPGRLRSCWSTYSSPFKDWAGPLFGEQKVSLISNFIWDNDHSECTNKFQPPSHQFMVSFLQLFSGILLLPKFSAYHRTAIEIPLKSHMRETSKVYCFEQTGLWHSWQYHKITTKKIPIQYEGPTNLRQSPDISSCLPFT